MSVEWDAEALRAHIQVQLSRIAGENEIRYTLIQQEMDRRFETALREMGLRDDHRTEMHQLMQEEMDRRFADTKAWLDERHESQKTALDERYATQTKALDKAFDASAEAVQVALANAEKAGAKAEAASDKRFASVNEFRQQLSDQTATFPTRNEVNTKFDGVSAEQARTTQRIADLELRLTSRLDLNQGSATGAAGSRTERLGEDTYTQTGQIARQATSRANISIAAGAVSALAASAAAIFVLIHG